MNSQHHDISVRLMGSHSEKGRVHLNDFARICDSLMRSLRAVERDITSKQPRTVFQITNLKCESAAIVVEPAPSKNGTDIGAEVASVWNDTVLALEHGDSVDARISFRSLERFRDLYKPVLSRKQKDKGGDLLVGGVPISARFAANVEKLLQTPIRSHGTVSGRLDKLNVHKKNEFTLYSPVGNFHVDCEFQDEILEDVRHAVKRHVTVEGVMYYRESQPYPARVDVTELRIHEDNASLPRLSELCGIAPNAGYGLDSVAAVRELRDG